MEYKYEIDNTYIHYIKFGEGKKAIAILSGISLRGFEGMGGAIEGQYKLLKDDYTVYIFDRRKYLKDKASIYDITEDVYRILKEEGVDKASIIGASQGGMMALSMAINHPEFVDKLIVVASSPYSTSLSREVFKRWEEYIVNDDLYGFNMYFYKKVYTEEYYNKYEKAFEKLATLGEKDEMKRFIILLDMMNSFDCRSELQKVKCKTLVMGGRKDQIFGVEVSEELAKALNCELYIYEDYAHAFYDEAPDFVNRVFDFLK